MTLLNTQETAVVRRPDEALRPGRAGGGARPARWRSGPQGRQGGAGLGRAGRVLPGAVHGGPGHLDRQRGATADETGLGLSTGGPQWVVNAYTLTFAGLLMLGGRAADLFGRRRVFLLGLGALHRLQPAGRPGAKRGLAHHRPGPPRCGGAPSWLRPRLSLLTTTFPGPAERRRALGAWSATAASGAAVGVLAGGFLTDLLDWRWVLFVNVPVGIALLAGAAWALSESRAGGASRRLDLPGALTVTAAMSIARLRDREHDTHPWGSARTFVVLAIGALFAGGVRRDRSPAGEHPLVPLGVSGGGRSTPPTEWRSRWARRSSACSSSCPYTCSR